MTVSVSVSVPCDDCRAGVPPAHQSPRRSASRRTPDPRLQRDSPIALPESAPSNDVWARNASRSGTVRHPKIGLRRHVRSRPIPRSFEARRQGASRNTRKTTPHRGAGSVFVQERPPGNASPRAQNADRAPPGGAMRSAVPAKREAAGVPSAWSQPSQSTHARPRRWCDAGSPGRPSVPAAQKAGAEGMVRNNGSDRDRGRIRIRGRWDQPASVHHHRRRDAGATNISAPLAAPASRGRWNQPASALPREARCGPLSRLRGRPPARHRRGPSLSINPRATTPMVRRWVAGTPKRPGGSEGRC